MSLLPQLKTRQERDLRDDTTSPPATGLVENPALPPHLGLQVGDRNQQEALERDGKDSHKHDMDLLN